MIIRHETKETGRTVTVEVEVETVEESIALHALLEQMKSFVSVSSPEAVRRFFGE